MPLRLTAADLANPNAIWVETLARLKPSLDPAAIQASLNVLDDFSEQGASVR